MAGWRQRGWSPPPSQTKALGFLPRTSQLPEKHDKVVIKYKYLSGKSEKQLRTSYSHAHWPFEVWSVSSNLKLTSAMLLLHLINHYTLATVNWVRHIENNNTFFAFPMYSNSNATTNSELHDKVFVSKKVLKIKWENKITLHPTDAAWDFTKKSLLQVPHCKNVRNKVKTTNIFMVL